MIYWLKSLILIELLIIQTSGVKYLCEYSIGLYCEVLMKILILVFVLYSSVSYSCQYFKCSKSRSGVEQNRFCRSFTYKLKSDGFSPSCCTKFEKSICVEDSETSTHRPHFINDGTYINNDETKIINFNF